MFGDYLGYHNENTEEYYKDRWPDATSLVTDAMDSDSGSTRALCPESNGRVIAVEGLQGPI